VQKTSKLQRLSRAQVLELVAHIVELQIGGGARVLYDQKLSETATHNLRQVDVAIFAEVSGREFLRIVEVQDRKSRVGSKFIDEVAGKLTALGAHRATIVAGAGFTKGAQNKVYAVHSPYMDLVELRPGKAEEWPSHFNNHSMTFGVTVNREGIVERITLPLMHRRYIDVMKRSVMYDVLYGHAETFWLSGVFCFVIDPHEDGNGLKDAWFVSEGNPINEASLTIDYTEPSGISALKTIDPDVVT
jgi:hypothetical protein